MSDQTGQTDQTDHVTPDTGPHFTRSPDHLATPDWGQTPVPVQEPASEPRGARTGMLWILAVIVLAAVVALIIAVAT
jgi:hypothetical protein